MNMNQLKYNLGSGYNYLDGFINVEHPKLKGYCKADEYWDLNKFPYPFKNASVIILKEVLEHLNDTVGVMWECYNMLIKGGELFITTPYYKHPSAYIDPSHIRYFTPLSFVVFQKDLVFGVFHQGGNNISDKCKDVNTSILYDKTLEAQTIIVKMVK